MSLRHSRRLPGLSTLLAIVIAAATLLVTGLMVWIVGGIATTDIKRTVGEILVERARTAADMIDDNMATRYLEVRQLAERIDRDPAYAGRAAEGRRELLEQVQTSAPQYAWIGVADAGGTVVASTGGMLEGVDISKRPWFSDAVKGIFVHDVHDAKLLAKHLPLDRGNPQRFVDLAFPVRLAEGKGTAAGVLGAHLSWGWIGQLGRMFNAPVADRPVEIMVLAADGTVLMGPDDAVGNVLDRLAPGALAASPVSSELQWVDGKRYITARCATHGKGDYPGMGWTVLARQQADSAYAHVVNMQRRIYQSGIALTLLFSVCGWLLARRLTAPLLKAAEAAAAIGATTDANAGATAGDNVATLSVRGGFYEVHTLTRAFDALLARLAQKRDELNTLNAALEHKVAQRTEALEASLAAKSHSEEQERAAQRKAQDSEKFLRTIADNSPALIAYLDQDQVYRFANDAHQRVLGIAPDAILGRHLAEVLGDDVYGVLRARIERVLEGTAMHFEEAFDRPGWPQHFMIDYIPDLDADGVVRGFHVLVTDISARKQIEIAQAANEKLAEAANRAKSEFVANMSHEIRTPMNAVLGASHLLGNTRLTGEQRGYLDLIESCGRSLLHIINDILDFSKIEAGKIQIEREAFDTHGLVEAAEAAMLSSGSKPGVELAIVVPADFPARLVGDAMRMRQIITNLVNNALKFTAAGEVVVSLALQGDLLEITVLDTGIGMSAAQQQRLFQPFEQADMSTSRKYGGTGLGLTISCKLVALMKGSIVVASEAGAGATFVVTLPVAAAGDGAPQRSEPAPPVAGALLFIDAHLASLRALLYSAAFHGLPAHSANTIDEAIALLNNNAAAGARIGVALVSAGLYAAAPERLRTAARAAGVQLVLMHAAAGPAFDAALFDGAVAKPVTRRAVSRLLAQLGDPGQRGDSGAPAATARPLAGRRLLLVEDNPINQLVASRLLELAGATPTVAENGRDALELLAMAQAPFDIILMDVQMPVMDGYEATRLLRERGVRTPILAMSAGVTQAERGECLAAGMDGFISKPVDAGQMIATIVEWLDRAGGVNGTNGTNDTNGANPTR
ncbi:ATP-binding protein [Duganella phyllosphaerae]|uniref:Sensory/regulatory protein RpfC n=1 Tax=Duganella phyllosphaerae TaxID=762836 RepID=A0A1E7WCJ1_9BURK|nr:ATP-binding protein [Duganella phyllosphaerae]OEZ95016.1 signal transduction histidine-protein kinase BarA [Duganella phyllosphaerae]